ncbi:hypothetical protein Pmani_030870 [Petrolisthes manimaculis]|uniref:Uncharacterized protein n=1 Tax=Petrolisthes manimaculis TaxID=1843537 RepID=A0AAE1NVS7_9EUCA|nr:hypothetical protein Pmani_030870 [Petrolisthes manimaculis]
MEQQRKKLRKARSYWVSPWLARRKLFGQWERLIHELARKDKSSCKNFLRVDRDLFMDILNKIGQFGPCIMKKCTFWREPLKPGLRLALTLRYLATGDNF